MSWQMVGESWNFWYIQTSPLVNEMVLTVTDSRSEEMSENCNLSRSQLKSHPSTFQEHFKITSNLNITLP